MTWALATVVLVLIVAPVSYYVGRLVGEERGRIDTYRKMADLNRRMRVLDRRVREGE